MNDVMIIIALTALICLAIIAFLTIGGRPVRWYDPALALPLLSIGLFFAYAEYFAPPGSCGSQNPDDCFVYGLLVAFVLGPLALITTPVHLFVLYRRTRQP